jgi:hypothetical protein
MVSFVVAVGVEAKADCSLQTTGGSRGFRLGL